jgi:hypothetical protein
MLGKLGGFIIHLACHSTILPADAAFLFDSCRFHSSIQM